MFYHLHGFLPLYGPYDPDATWFVEETEESSDPYNQMAYQQYAFEQHPGPTFGMPFAPSAERSEEEFMAHRGNGKLQIT